MKLLVATTVSEPRFSYEVSNTVPYDDVTIEELVELFKDLALAMGYHPDIVKEAFSDTEGS